MNSYISLFLFMCVFMCEYKAYYLYSLHHSVNPEITVSIPTDIWIKKMQLLPPILLLFTLFNAAVFGFEAMNHITIQSAIVVDKSGSGNFQTVQAAIDSVPPHNNQWIKIQINPGVYR